MSEEDFYKEKIFNKISINALKLKYPHLNNSKINGTNPNGIIVYKSTRHSCRQKLLS